ncbi:MAG TPA: response regulator [Polyangia bacterium]|nr:response regulator [Polyangia bacterium]
MKILVVDDSRAMRAYVRGVLLGSFDCTVVEASSGFEAIRLLPRDLYDIVITDINMPDINGLELIRLVRKSDRHGRVPIVIISTLSSDDDHERALALGATSYLDKPFAPADIVRAIDSALAGPGAPS